MVRSRLRAALERLQVRPDAMHANLTRGGPGTATSDESPDAAGVLVDRALQAHAKGP